MLMICVWLDHGLCEMEIGIRYESQVESTRYERFLIKIQVFTLPTDTDTNTDSH